MLDLAETLHQHRRVLREQAQASRRGRAAQRRAIACCGGDPKARWAEPDGAGRQRAAAAVGVTRDVVLCGCGQAGCETCLVSRPAGGCGCGRTGCGTCVPRFRFPIASIAGGSAPRTALLPFTFGVPSGGLGAGRSAMLLLPPGGGGGSAPTIPWPWVPGSPIVTWPDIPDFSYLADIEISTSYTIPSSSSEDATVYPSVGGYFDVHAHSFCSTESDWATAEVSYDCLPTNTVDRIDWLYDALTAEGIGMAAISGQADPSAGSDFIADTATVNEVTLFAYQRYPDFFAPFIQIFPEDLTDSTFGASSYVDALLAAGEFKGVGELFIHGHGTNINENGYLYGICLAAARYGAPVQMHYEIGFVDDESVRTSEDNYDQLVALLDMFINVPIASHTYHVDTEPMPLKVILCHCGGAPRPGNYAAWDSTDEDLYVAYIARMEALLARYPNVFFDLAGMQVGGNQQLFPGSSYGGTETRFGSDLLTLIAAYPSRFLFGTDTENRYDVDTYAYSYTAVSPGWAWYNGVDHWQDSVQGYVDFLGTLGATIQAQVMGANTVFAIYTKARRI